MKEVYFSVENLIDEQEKIIKEKIYSDLYFFTELEIKIVEEALKNISQKNIEIIITKNISDYMDYLKNKKKEDRKVYLLVDEYNNLKDLQPLLDFVSDKTIENYIKFRNKYFV